MCMVSFNFCTLYSPSCNHYFFHRHEEKRRTHYYKHFMLNSGLFNNDKTSLSATTLMWWYIHPTVWISLPVTSCCLQSSNMDCINNLPVWTQQMWRKKCSKSSIVIHQKNSPKQSRKTRPSVWWSVLWWTNGILKRIVGRERLPSLRMSILYPILNKCQFVKFYLSFFFGRGGQNCLSSNAYIGCN